MAAQIWYEDDGDLFDGDKDDDDDKTDDDDDDQG